MPVIRVTKNKHLAYARVGDLELVAFAELPHVSNDDLREFIAGAEHSFSINGPVSAFFTYSKTARLNPLQRQLIADTTKALKTPLTASVIVTDSLVVRGMLTAMGWMVRDVKINSFSTAKVPDAFDWIEQHCKFQRVPAERMLAQLLETLTIP